MRGSGMRGSDMRGSGMRGLGMRESGMKGSGMRGSGMRGLGMMGSGLRGSGIRGSGNPSASPSIQCAPLTRVFFCFFGSSAPSSVCALERLYTCIFWQQRSLEFCILGFFLMQALRHRVEAFSLSARSGFVLSALLWVCSRKLLWPSGHICVGVHPKISGRVSVLPTSKLLRPVTISKR